MTIDPETGEWLIDKKVPDGMQKPQTDIHLTSRMELMVIKAIGIFGMIRLMMERAVS